MPLTLKGRRIMRAMTKPKGKGGYGKAKGKSVFYAMINAKKLRGAHRKRKR